MAFLFHNGRYKCENLLGSGAYGKVYRAYDSHLGRWVALKLLTTGEPLAFATREAIALTALEGPHILRVINADRHQDVPYLATEIVDGGTAQDHLGLNGACTDVSVRWIRHMLIGLGVCHGRGLLHRDVKPSNIFLKSDDEALLGDFGVCAVMASGSAVPAGTPEIRAPECWTSGGMTVASEIYSSGLALYVLLTGRFPFVGATDSEVRDAVLARKHPRLRDLAPHVSQALATRVEKAMSLDPADRYRSAAEFHEALGQLATDGYVWCPRPRHAGHNRCWSARAGAAGSSLNVCVTQIASGFEVETRHAGGSRRRVAKACGNAANERQLAVVLRRSFNSL